MEECRTEEVQEGEDRIIRAWPASANDIITSCRSVADESQNKLTERGAIDWGAATPGVRSRSPGEKSGLDSSGFTEIPLDSSGICRASGLSSTLLATLRSLAEHDNHMLLPRSLHQIAESYFLEEDYPWAVQFLRLEQLYHERLLSNLASLQEEWESQWKAGAEARSSTSVKTQSNDTELKCMDSLSQICQTHQRPNRTMEKVRRNSNKHHRIRKYLPRDFVRVEVLEYVVSKAAFLQDVVDLSSRLNPEGRGRSVAQEPPRGDPAQREEKEDSSLLGREPEEEEDDEDEELEEELGEELEEALEDDGLMDELQEDLTKRGLSCGDKLVKPVPAEQSFPSQGLVSILKKTTSHDRDGAAKRSPPKGSYRRKVRFRETDNLLDNDEVGGDSCLVFFLLCLATVVISMGGTALFCLLGGAYSNVCTDFSQNVDFYFGPVRRAMGTVTYWFTPSSSSSSSSPC